jgi:hypothetical protein
MSPRAAKYQEFVTGHTVDEAYVVKGVKFDGHKGGKLLDAKGPGYKKFVKKGEFDESWWRGGEGLRKQAQDQIRAAGGAPIEWHVAEREAVPAFKYLLEKDGYTQIKVVHMPQGTP